MTDFVRNVRARRRRDQDSVVAILGHEVYQLSPLVDHVWRHCETKLPAVLAAEATLARLCESSNALHEVSTALRDLIELGLVLRR